MTNKEKFAQKMLAAGVCDERGAAFCATAVALPDGSFGMCLLGLAGSTLSIYDTDMKSSVGKLLYAIPLKEVTGLKVTGSLLKEIFTGYSFQFTHNGFQYKFKNCAQNKAALAAIASEAP